MEKDAKTVVLPESLVRTVLWAARSDYISRSSQAVPEEKRKEREKEKNLIWDAISKIERQICEQIEAKVPF